MQMYKNYKALYMCLYTSKSITMRSDGKKIAIQIHHEDLLNLETILRVLVFSDLD